MHKKRVSWPRALNRRTSLVTDSLPLMPIKVVVRELTRPDGVKVMARVPVYPPFSFAPTDTKKKEEPLRNKDDYYRNSGGDGD